MSVPIAPLTIVFDGDCALCNGWTALLDRDPHAYRFEFVPAQSPRGGALLDRAGVSPTALATIVVIDGTRAYLRSDAVLHAMTRMGGAWRALGWLRAIPRPLRDLGYRAVAASRHRVFGAARSCRIARHRA